MKKFLIASLVVGIAGVGIGVARRHDTGSTAAAAVAPPTSTTVATATSLPAATPTTTARVIVEKAKPVTTTTRARAVAVPVTAPPARAVTTTTAAVATTTTTVAPFVPQCTLTMTLASVSKLDTQTATISSDRPSTRFRFEVQYIQNSGGLRGNPRQDYELTTDASGGSSQSFKPKAPSTGPAQAWVRFYNDKGQLILDDGCATEFGSV